MTHYGCQHRRPVHLPEHLKALKHGAYGYPEGNAYSTLCVAPPYSLRIFDGCLPVVLRFNTVEQPVNNRRTVGAVPEGLYFGGGTIIYYIARYKIL